MTVTIEVTVKNSIHQVAECAAENYSNRKTHKKIALPYPVKINQQPNCCDNGKNGNDKFKIRTKVYSKCNTRILYRCDVKKFIYNGNTPALRKPGMFQVKEWKIKTLHINLGDLIGKKYQERNQY